MSPDDEILREFLLETHENLALLDSDLVKLEINPAEKSTLAQVFRTFHSVKGTAGFMGLVKLQEVSHAAENLLSKLRAGEITFNPPIATALLRVVDAIREILSNIESTGVEGSGDYTGVAAEVDRLRQQNVGESKPLPATSAIPAPTLETRIELPPPASTLEISESPSAELEFTFADTPVPSGESAEKVTSHVADAAIRVDVGLLDKLMTLVGELVLARNQILQHSQSHEDSGFLGAVQQLNLLTTELQTSVMKTRMQPIGNVLSKFPRIVRDLSVACGKQVRVEIDGQETELDKTLIEAIRDPLTHLIRNAVDHGIEPPAVRKSHGKPEEGWLKLVAFHEGGKVIVEISDDGGGIDETKVRDKALKANLITAEVADRMSRQDLLRLIFVPGFSTADRVTQFSGRGVGMDVVRTNLERIGGTVDIESTPGQGTTIRTKIPLTLAIIPALIVASGGERYAIPQVNLLELVWLDAEHAQHGIERLHGVPVYRLRGKLLPLVFLDEQLQLATLRKEGDELNIVVLQADERPFGLVVEAIRDTEEIVVKPLQKLFKGISAFAGAAIMGDGRVALVLDPVGLAQRASVISGARGRALGEETAEITTPIESHALLLFAPTAGGRMAVPLADVARLEEFSRSRLESLGERLVVQYRGEILPLLDVSAGLAALAVPPSPCGPGPAALSDLVSVVVYDAGAERIGLIVGAILDIVNDPLAIRALANREGVLFTAVVHDQVTEFLDVAALIEATKPPHLHSVK
ncbi:chemotaxis protein CheA [Anatilimnocola floriformis]|uniref:chemotaxis protein CheA n=1 Tax=Anatilimnocola floriformis TaxID=2948575 RepID=UPI0020C307E1|nr:chemotaxis protein CheA [Anatilimnocola floriformis]